MTAVAQAAFAPYVGRLGDIEPWPMHVDYAEKIADGHTWVAEDAGAVVVGLLVLEPHDDHLLLDVVGIAPGHQGTGLGHRLMASQTSRRATAGSARGAAVHERGDDREPRVLPAAAGTSRPIASRSARTTGCSSRSTWPDHLIG